VSTTVLKEITELHVLVLIGMEVAFILLFVFLRVEFRRGQTWNARLKRIDYGGNCIFIAAICAILIALTWGGPVYQWDNFHIVVPLVIGIAGLILFIGYEWSLKLAEPSVPRVLVSNRTSAAALALTMLSAISTYWTLYVIDLYNFPSPFPLLIKCRPGTSYHCIFRRRSPTSLT
jgi:hypothetical protein